MNVDLSFNKNRYIREFFSSNLLLEIVPGWVEYKFKDERISDPLNFVKEDGVGALQISIATTSSGKIFYINNVLKNNKQEDINRRKKYKLRDWEVYEYEENKDGRFIKYFCLEKPKIIVYVTYNCDLNKLNKRELNEAIKIVKTIDVISKI